MSNYYFNVWNNVKLVFFYDAIYAGVHCVFARFKTIFIIVSRYVFLHFATRPRAIYCCVFLFGTYEDNTRLHFTFIVWNRVRPRNSIDPTLCNRLNRYKEIFEFLFSNIVGNFTNIYARLWTRQLCTVRNFHLRNLSEVVTHNSLWTYRDTKRKIPDAYEY